MTKPEHRPGAKIRREKVKLDYCRATLSDARMGEGYRLSLSRRRMRGHGADVWIPVHDWRSLDYDLPRDGLSQWEVHQALETMEAEAARRYQAEMQQEACRRRRRMISHREHTEPQHDVETEHYDGAAHSRIIT